MWTLNKGISMTETLLVVEGLQSGYGDIQVLWGIDLVVQEGEIVCLVGSNGVGKTTLLRSISGLLNLRAGRLLMQGLEITGLGPDKVLQSGIAHVPEGRRLFRTMSVVDNLLMGAYMRTKEESEIRIDLERVMQMFPRLAERRHQDAGTLSGGEQQMCAIGRGIMSRPKLLMIDELSLGLAPKVVETLGESLRDIRSSGVSILLVEQDVMTAFELADRGYVIDQGKVSMSGPSQELLQAPEIREAYLGM